MKMYPSPFVVGLAANNYQPACRQMGEPDDRRRDDNYSSLASAVGAVVVLAFKSETPACVHTRKARSGRIS